MKDLRKSLVPQRRLPTADRASTFRLPLRRTHVLLGVGVLLIILELRLLAPGTDAADYNDPTTLNAEVAGLGAETRSGPFVFTETGMFVSGTRTRSGVVIPVAGVTLSDLENSWGAPRSDGRRHVGIDIAAPTGTPLMAAVDGWVVALSYNDAGGRGLHLQDRSGQFLLYYAHLDGYAEGVYAGMAVRQGELLGYVGSTGNAAMPHLHLEVGRLRGAGTLRVEPLNPYAFLRGDIPLSSGADAR